MVCLVLFKEADTWIWACEFCWDRVAEALPNNGPEPDWGERPLNPQHWLPMYHFSVGELRCHHGTLDRPKDKKLSDLSRYPLDMTRHCEVNHFWDDIHHIAEVQANSFP